ncbi:MAG: hypothetical protein H6747_13825 [Deltaproteobacteria bacterium]|nr:hypothetical protein [Deltaproteobacteria bacterium]
MSGWGRSGRSYGYFQPYVSVPARLDAARREAERLRGPGGVLEPVEIVGKGVAKTFWGKGWCTQIERHADWLNRLERGRRYLRNGSVVDLRIEPGVVEAVVAGTSPYEVHVAISPLGAERWDKLAKDCGGKVASLLALLQGTLDAATLKRLCHPTDGMFPLPQEMLFDCSCPDGAMLCKHVAATLYGVGHRLDAQPELLFTLRQVDVAALLGGIEELGAAATAATDDGLGDGEDLAAIFGVDFAEPEPVPVPEPEPEPDPAAATPVSPAPEAPVAGSLGRHARRLLRPLAEQPDEEFTFEGVLLLAIERSAEEVRQGLEELGGAGLVAASQDGEGTWWFGVTQAGVVAASASRG